MDPPLLEPELRALLAALQDAPSPLREYDLLERLRGPSPLRELTELETFRVHFLLFHHLYRLQAALRRAQWGTLEIHCLDIHLVPGPTASSLPARPDPLAAYYLDLTHLERATQESVLGMLQDFWVRFGAWFRRDDALEVLGLAPGATADQVRSRYRELCLLHHPDRGGDAGEFVRVATAMERLRQLP